MIYGKGRKIIICHDDHRGCGGYGITDNSFGVSIPCPTCNGTGRLIEQEFAYYTPFDVDNSVLRLIDSKTHELFRDIEVQIKSKQFIRESKINQILNENQ